MKHNTVLAAIVFALFFFVLSLTCKSQMQVRVDSVSFPSRSQANICGHNTKGEKVYLKYGMRNARYAIKPGTILTVWRVGNKRRGNYTRAIIKLNN